jgi:PIN domain nuclease of toxin-antitoxin system
MLVFESRRSRPRSRSAELGCVWDHRDPADRLIVATALDLGAPLATRDERIRTSAIPGLLTAW